MYIFFAFSNDFAEEPLSKKNMLWDLDQYMEVSTQFYSSSILRRFEYPQPTFQKLMKEQCMEPFFVFQVSHMTSIYAVIIFHLLSSLVFDTDLHAQVFCVGLWCMDEYWYYSLFTLFMLFLFESTMAKSRLKTLTELRRVSVDSQTLMVHRCGKYV